MPTVTEMTRIRTDVARVVLGVLGERESVGKAGRGGSKTAGCRRGGVCVGSGVVVGAGVGVGVGVEQEGGRRERRRTT
jgi:hypothetical protein